MHGHGGILIEHQKLLALHMDLGPDDTFFWLTSTGWVMWNLLVGGLLRGSAIVLYDGAPAHPGPDRLWALAEDARVTYFGVGAAYLHGCLKAGLVPRERFDLSRLRAVGSTGSPLSPAGFEWVHRRVGEHVPVGSVCGGTDVASAFVGPCPTLPVRAGEIQCRCLGVKAEAYDAGGKATVGDVGELVIEAPMPSMPVSFWNDPGGARYRASYFERFAGVWTHGDWVRFSERGTCVVYGRSDATLNRGGIRLGTRDYYDLVESFDEVDGLAVDLPRRGHRRGWMPLFVVLRDGARRSTTRLDRPAPGPSSVADCFAAPRAQTRVCADRRAVPRTLSGRALEVPVKRILLRRARRRRPSAPRLRSPIRRPLAPVRGARRDLTDTDRRTG